MTVDDPRPRPDVAGPACQGQLTSQVQVDQAVKTITDYCRLTGRRLAEVATEILEGRLVLTTDTVRAPHPEVLGRPA